MPFIVGFLFLLLNSNCQSIIDYSDRIQESRTLFEDNKFIYLDKDEKEIKDFKEVIQEKEKKINEFNNFYELNNYSVSWAIKKNPKHSILLLKSYIKKNLNNISAYLNLSRIYFLTNNPNGMTSVYNNFLKSNPNNTKFLFQLNEEFLKRYREEERDIFLNSITSYKDFSLSTLEEIGIYLFKNLDYKRSFIIFDKLLVINPYHKTGLFYLIKLNFWEDNFAGVVKYSNNLLEQKQINKESYYMVIRSFYELGKYRDVLKMIELTPDTEKVNFDFLITWRNSLLILEPKNDLKILKPFFEKLILDNKNLRLNEINFRISSSPECQNQFYGVFYGQ